MQSDYSKSDTEGTRAEGAKHLAKSVNSIPAAWQEALVKIVAPCRSGEGGKNHTADVQYSTHYIAAVKVNIDTHCNAFFICLVQKCGHRIAVSLSTVVSLHQIG